MEMPHLHTFQWVVRTTIHICTGCGAQYRFASYDEAVDVQRNDRFNIDGPCMTDSAAVLVPVGWSA